MSGLVLPGECIPTGEEGFLRGHGTYAVEIENTYQENQNDLMAVEELEDDRENSDDDGEDIIGLGHPASNQELIACVTGTVERVNKLVSIVPSTSAVYNPQVGDSIVGRIVSIQSNRWKVSLISGSLPNQHLLLSGVNLPNGAQRIRTAEDALGMRMLFAEGDLVSAEVQQVMKDGVASLHTRSSRYGKLQNGCIVVVPPGLIPRMKQHFCCLPELGVNLILGKNGCIWIQRVTPQELQESHSADNDTATAPRAEILEQIRKHHVETPVLPHERLAISRVKNAIEALRLIKHRITPDTIKIVCQESMALAVQPKLMMETQIILQITHKLREQK